MKLYLLERTDIPDYEEMSSCIIAARSSKRALELSEIRFGSYRKKLEINRIGKAKKGIKEGLILEDNTGA